MNIQDMLKAIKAKGYSDRAIAERAEVDTSIITRLRNGTHKSTNFAAGKEIERLYKEVMTAQGQAAPETAAGVVASLASTITSLDEALSTIPEQEVPPPKTKDRRRNPSNAASQKTGEAGGARTARKPRKTAGSGDVKVIEQAA